MPRRRGKSSIRGKWQKVVRKGAIFWRNNRFMIIKNGSKYTARIRVNKKWVYLGEFNSWKAAKSVFYVRSK